MECGVEKAARKYVNKNPNLAIPMEAPTRRLVSHKA